MWFQTSKNILNSATICTHSSHSFIQCFLFKYFQSICYMPERVPEASDITGSKSTSQFLLKSALWLKRQTANKQTNRHQIQTVTKATEDKIKHSNRMGKEETLLDRTNRKGPVRRWPNPRKGGWGQGGKVQQRAGRLDQGQVRGVEREGQRSQKEPDRSGVIGQGLANCGPEAKSGPLLVLYRS